MVVGGRQRKLRAFVSGGRLLSSAPPDARIATRRWAGRQIRAGAWLARQCAHPHRLRMVGGGIHEARLRAALNGTWRLLAPAFCPFRKTITSEAASSAGGLFYSEISVRCRLMALSGHSNRTRVCPLLDQSGQRSIFAGDRLSANDP